MRHSLIVALAFLAWATGAHAEYELKLKDGSSLVWPRYVEKEKQYCTEMSYGEFCVFKSDVASIRKTDEKADDAYNAEPVSEKAQKEISEQKKNKERDMWREVEESQRQRMREEAEARRKREGYANYDEY